MAAGEKLAEMTKPDIANQLIETEQDKILAEYDLSNQFGEMVAETFEYMSTELQKIWAEAEAGETHWWDLVEPDEFEQMKPCSGVFCVNGKWIDADRLPLYYGEVK